MSIFVDHKALKHLLRKLKDVLISGPADGDVLTYEAATALWKNKPSPGAQGIKLLGYVEGSTDINTSSGSMTLMSQMALTVPVVANKRILAMFSAGIYGAYADTLPSFEIQRDYAAFGGGSMYLTVSYTTFPITLFSSYLPAASGNVLFQVYWATYPVGYTIYNLGTQVLYRRRFMVQQEI